MYRHEILYLNPKRVYLRVGDTWYDNHADYKYQIGDRFLLGAIDEILTYDQYKKKYPHSKNEMGPKVTEKTGHQGYIRKVTGRCDEKGITTRYVEYAVNPQQITLNVFDVIEE
jgi:hypothetical protein